MSKKQIVTVQQDSEDQWTWTLGDRTSEPHQFFHEAWEAAVLAHPGLLTTATVNGDVITSAPA